jgi:hypothetical protein
LARRSRGLGDVYKRQEHVLSKKLVLSLGEYQCLK